MVGGNFASNTFPYVQTSIGNTNVPGGVSVTLPAIELSYLVTGAPGDVLRTGISQYRNSVTANAGIFGNQTVTFWAYPTTGNNTEITPPVAPMPSLLNSPVVG